MPDLRVTTQSKEALKVMVRGVVGGNGIGTVERSLPEEILVVVSGDVHRLAKTWGLLGRSSTTSAESCKLSICEVPRGNIARTHGV